jgi:hypothetical protein
MGPKTWAQMEKGRWGKRPFHILVWGNEVLGGTRLLND